MRIAKRATPFIVSFGIMSAATIILWRIRLSTAISHELIYFYLLPVVLIAALYSGRLALLCTAIAMLAADYFLQAPLYSLANDNPLEYGDLICFAVLAAMAIKCIRLLLRPRTGVWWGGSNIPPYRRQDAPRLRRS